MSRKKIPARDLWLCVCLGHLTTYMVELHCTTLLPNYLLYMEELLCVITIFIFKNTQH
jgi:hypothetical protein